MKLDEYFKELVATLQHLMPVFFGFPEKPKIWTPPVKKSTGKELT